MSAVLKKQMDEEVAIIQDAIKAELDKFEKKTGFVITKIKKRSKGDNAVIVTLRL